MFFAVEAHSDSQNDQTLVGLKTGASVRLQVFRTEKEKLIELWTRGVNWGKTQSIMGKKEARETWTRMQKLVEAASSHSYFI